MHLSSIWELGLRLRHRRLFDSLQDSQVAAQSSPRDKSDKRESDIVVERENVIRNLSGEYSKVVAKLWKCAHAAVLELRRTKELQRETSEIVLG